jgi:Kef-type K+ transport system membrane component KefB
MGEMLSTLQVFFAEHAFAELAAVVTVVVAVTALMRVLKQPLIIGYIIAGILMSPTILNLIQHTDSVQMFAHIGVAFLLFMVGLWLNPAVVKDLGKASLVVWVWQVVFTTGIGMGIALLLGFDRVTSIYVAIALAFSSTIIIVKLLSDKWVLDELYGKISIGMLIVQDIIAMVILMVLASLPVDGAAINRGIFSGILLAKMAVVGLVVYMLTKYILPRIMWYVAQSQEFLLLFSIGRCLLFAAGLEAIGFSLEIGALLAWLTLATLPYRFEISSRMKPLRDFFIVLFFVFLGSQLQFSDVSVYIVPIIVFSAFVLIGNPFIVMVLMGWMGYKRKNGMMVWFTVAQISEFSFILMGLALAIGHISNVDIVSMVTIVWLITIAWSSYYFAYADQIYARFGKYLKIFEKKRALAETHFACLGEDYDVIVFGNHRTGEGILKSLQKNGKRFLIVDYDPQVIRELEAKGIPCLYGDASDIETLEELCLHRAKMIVSTVHDYEANALILQYAQKAKNDLVTILSANKVAEAEVLYTAGAHYVLVPHVIGGQHTAMLIEEYAYDVSKYVKHRAEFIG